MDLAKRALALKFRMKELGEFCGPLSNMFVLYDLTLICLDMCPGG